MDINNFKCGRCGETIAPWMSRRPQFNCPNCNASYHSNYKALLSRSVYLFLSLWFLTGLGIVVFTGSWPLALALSLELGWILALVIAYLFFRSKINVNPAE